MKRVSALRKAHGFTAVAALVWIVTLSTLAAVAASMADGSSYAASLQGLSVRAQAAADAGLEWGRLEASQGVCLATATFSGAGAIPGFEDMSIVVKCSSSVSQEGAVTVQSFAISSVACSAQGSDCQEASPPRLYARRQAVGSAFK